MRHPRAALCEREGKGEALPQFRLERCHLSIVGFVVLSGEMEHAMQNQDTQLFGQRMSQPFRVVGGNINRDGKIAGGACMERDALLGRGGKAEHIRHLVFFAILTVELLEAITCSEENADLSLEFCRTVRGLCESDQGAATETTGWVHDQGRAWTCASMWSVVFHT